MGYSHLNYLIRVKHAQDMTKEKFARFIYVSYKEIWNMLCIEGKFFYSYRTYLKYINEPNVRERIRKITGSS